MAFDLQDQSLIQTKALPAAGANQAYSYTLKALF